MWRDRTNLFISYRQSYAHHPAKRSRLNGPASNGFSAGGGASEERQGLMSAAAFEDDGDAIIEMDLLPPRWVDVSDEVTELLAVIARKSAKLDRLHSKYVLPGFDEEDVRRKEEGEIETLTQEITRDFHGCQRAIQKVEMMVRESKQSGGGVSQGEENMARNIQISLAGRVQEASAGFRKKQSAYLKSKPSDLESYGPPLLIRIDIELRGFGGMTPPLDRAGTPSQNPYSDPSMMESDADKSFSQSTLLQTSQKQLTSNDAVIMQREREITDIAKGIIELADIFKDLQTMVIDQGTMLDRIDYNVERMTTDVKGAEKELVMASGYQRRTTKRKIIFLLILLIVGLIIVLVFKPRRSSSSVSNPPEIPSEQGKASGEGWTALDGAPEAFGGDSSVPPRRYRRKRKRRPRDLYYF
ncbi:MAG: hypothetical protein M1814_002479 [Vezdaea aestivalis]|nr:MAG: hypothetical protein M1814_002479 [Vezdaea aestivalis]